MAKEQSLSLNPTKISGVCGRLMCCLKNEAETYEYLNIKPINLEEDQKEVEANIKMPYLIGKSLTEAISILNKLGLIFEIDEEKVVHIADFQ